MNDDTRGILVGYDGSPDGDEALTWAADTALLDHRPLTVAIINDPGVLPGVAWVPEDYWVEIAHRATEGLAKVGLAEAGVERRRGAVVPTLIGMARDASLVVVGSRGHSRVGEMFVGSVSQHLAGHAPCPVAVVRPVSAGSSDVARIVVGLDGSTASEDALAFACRRARLTGEKVAAVRAAEYGPVPLDWRGGMPQALGLFLEEEERQLAKLMAGAVTAHPDIEIESELIALAPGEALVETSRNASLVVVGSRGLGAFAGMLLGSVSHDVLHRAHCPVVVVR